MDALKSLKDKLLLANGELSDREAAHNRANVALAQKLDLEVTDFPGAHLGHASHPEQFAQKLLQVLKAKDQYYSGIRSSCLGRRLEIA